MSRPEPAREPAGHSTGSLSADVSRVVAETAELLGGESGPSRAFLGGLVAGALVGAAIAGASLLRSRGGAPPARPRRH